MKQNGIRPFAVAACMLFLGGGYAQVTTLGNVPFGAGNFVGWDNTVTNDPLQIRHDANQPIQWFTDAIARMMLNPTVTTSINGLPAAVRDGFLLLSGTDDAFTDPNSNAPFTRLHLIDPVVNAGVPQVYAQEFGYRNWQRNGVTFTGNHDQAYIGQRYYSHDSTDLVIHRSDIAGIV